MNQNRYVVVSESRGIFLGPNLWSKDDPDKKPFLKVLKFAPCFDADVDLTSPMFTPPGDCSLKSVVTNMPGGNVTKEDRPDKAGVMTYGLRSQGFEVWD